MFTSEHLIWIALCAAFVCGMLVYSKKSKMSLKRAGLIMSGICCVSEFSKIMSTMIESAGGGMHLDPLSLPFHLCSLMIFAVFFITFSKEGETRQHVMDFVAVMGTLGGICAILIPTNGTEFTSVLSYQCFVYHAGLLWFSLYLIRSGNAHLGKNALIKNWLILMGLVFIDLYVNSFLSAYDTNFLYLVRPPMENLPILNLNHGWYVYFLTLVSLGTAALVLFHLPFFCKEKKNG